MAIKLLRPALRAGSRDSGAGARLQREAESMARVSHPNVAHVYARIAVREQRVMASDELAGQILVDAPQLEVSLCVPDPIGDTGLHLIIGEDAATGLRVHDGHEQVCDLFG